MDIFKSYSSEFIAKFERISSLINHTQSIGNYREELLRSFLSNLLGNRFSIKTGFIHDRAGALSSRQIDILIIDENDPAGYLFKEDSFAIVNPRAVVCAIEVKSNFNISSFRDIADHAFSFRKIMKSSGQFFAFCFKNESPELRSLGSWFSEISHIPNEIENYANSVYLFDKGKLQIVTPTSAEPFGSYFMEPKSNPKDINTMVLAEFLSTIVKHCEIRAGIVGNPYRDYMPDSIFTIYDNCYRYGIGATQGKIKKA
ncbi:DUF6602 domain-containing protein [Leptospira wolffii]|uniref:DUF6602 domain-containing protein n=1 Tax=Leptospira wolffii TaxID=409998 RepID=UPI0003095034|nr:DUF6602 domain-containing protein [Leptospira wolffii]EPG66458.1 hypothetical protein LEP1GSC061_1015 [Leptospira wolffii serovar Khorat str. Khorat-H2]